MPDGDKVYAGNLPRVFQRPYEEICEGVHDFTSIAGRLLEGVRHCVRWYGTEPIDLLLQAAEMLESDLAIAAIQSPADWRKIMHDIEQHARLLHGKRRPMNLALEACRQYLHELQDGNDTEPHRQALIRKYLEWVYSAQFIHRTPLDDHHYGIGQPTFTQRLGKVSEYVETTLLVWATGIARTERLTGVMRVPRHLRPHLDLDTDLVGNWEVARELS